MNRAYESQNDGQDKSCKSTNSMVTIEVQGCIQELKKEKQNLSNESKKIFFDLNRSALAKKFQMTKDEILKMNNSSLISFQNDLIFFGLEETMRIIRKMYDEREDYLKKEKYVSAKEIEEKNLSSNEPRRSLGNKIKKITDTDFMKNLFLQENQQSSIPSAFENEITKDDSTNFDNNLSSAYLKRNHDTYSEIHPEEKKNPSKKKRKTNIQEQRTPKNQNPLALVKEDHPLGYKYLQGCDSETKFSEEMKDNFEKFDKKKEPNIMGNPKELASNITKEAHREEQNQRMDYYRKYWEEYIPTIFNQYFTAFPLLKNDLNEAVKIDMAGEKLLLIKLIFLQIEMFCKRSIKSELWKSKKTDELLERWNSLVSYFERKSDFIKSKIINWESEEIDKRVIFNSFFLDLFNLGAPDIGDMFNILQISQITRINPDSNLNFRVAIRKLHQIFKEDGFLDTEESILLKLFIHKPDDAERKFVSDIRAYIEQRKTELLQRIDEFIPNSLILIETGCMQGKTLRNSEIAIQFSLLGVNDKYSESKAAKLLLVLLHEMAHRIFMRGFNSSSILDNTPQKMTLGGIDIDLPPDEENSEAGKAFELFVFKMVISAIPILTMEICHKLITLRWNKDGIKDIKEAIQREFKHNIFQNGKELLKKFDESKDKSPQGQIQEKKKDENTYDDNSGKFSSQPYQNFSHHKDPCYQQALKSYYELIKKLTAPKSEEIVEDVLDTSFSQNET